LALGWQLSRLKTYDKLNYFRVLFI
jgi:hypothetical protein